MGGHFYLDEHRSDVLHVVQRILDESFKKLPLSIRMSDYKVPDHCYTSGIHEAFRENVSKYTDRDAVVEEKGTISYAQLLRRADVLASKLQRDFLNGKERAVIALLLPHDMDNVACMLAIWEVSGVILLLETLFPSTFCADVCQESLVDVGLTNPSLLSKIDGVDMKNLVLGEGWLQTLQQEHRHVELPRAKPDDLALLCMTSGTTGKPKTIAGHHSFMHVGALAKNVPFPFTEGDNREAFNVMFAWEVLRPLLSGDTCFILSDSAMIDPFKFFSLISKWKCSRVLTTPSLLTSIMAAAANDVKERLAHMRVWWMRGEILPVTTVRHFAELLPKCKLVNDYSTWESGDVGLAMVCPRTNYEPSQTFACVGEVATNAAVAINVPDTMRPVRRGVAGEIYVGGNALSQGYYMQPELTTSRDTGILKQVRKAREERSALSG